MGFFDKKVKTKVVQSPEEAQARRFLSERLSNPVQQPTRQIAPMSKSEQTAADLSQQFGEAPSEGGQFLSGILGQDSNILNDPAFRALFEETKEFGQQETNRVGRSLQQRGGTSSTTGRDVLGRSVAENQRNLMATLAPHIQAREERRVRVAQLSDDSIIKRLNALSATGGLQRSLDQLAKDAAFQQQLATIQAPLDITERILSRPANQMTTVGASGFDKVSGALQLAGGVAKTVLNPRGFTTG